MQNLTNEFCELRKQYIDAKFMTMNPMQKKAIYNVDGPVLVLAGAGSGKTTTIIGRIVYMVMFGHAYYSTETTFPVTEGDIKELKSVLSGTGSISEHLKSMLQVKPVSPQNIMAVTFTNKAAGEMKKRLESKLGKDTAEKVCAKTFHSACVGILREYAMFVGFKRDFTIYDEKDCKSVLKDIYKANGIKEKELHKDDVLNHISIWKDKMITPDMAISQSTISSYNTVAHLYKEYQERLKNANAMDFDDLIGNTIRLLKEHPDIQAELQKKIQYIMVDEYQDTNASQHELLSLLVSPDHNICVVGDDDQSIYSFRGADVDNILNFPQEFDGTDIIKMEQNYRSDGNILNLANSLIGHNTKRHNKNLWTYRNPGVMPTYTYYTSDYDETDSIVEDIKDYIAAGNNYSDVAILYRNSRLSYVIERSLAREKIPYKIVGGFKFFERAEVKDIIAYLCVIANPADDQRLKRIINVPARKIGAATVDKIATLAQQYKVSMMEIIRNADLYPAIAKAKPALDSFIKMYDTMCLMANGSTLGELTQSVIKYSGYRKMLEDKGVDGKDELQNVEQVVVAAEEFEHAHIKTNLSEFLAEISLLSAVDTLSSEENKVVMMTLHASKGLEFKNVYIIGLEDSIIPSSRDDVGIEEERRLLYVGMTRAKEELHLSTAKQRHTFGAWGEEDKPSRFLYDIDQQDIDYGTSRNNIFARKNTISWDMNALFWCLMRMNEDDLKLLLAKNPALSVEQITPKKQQSITPGKTPLSKKNKYFNIPVYVFSDGFVFVDEDNQIKSLAASELPKIHGKVTAKFDSVKEYERYKELKLMVSANVITDLKRQVPLIIQEKFVYQGKTVRPIIYCADFVYRKDEKTVVEDVKGFDKKTGKWRTTQTFELKWKLLKARYPHFDFVLI